MRETRISGVVNVSRAPNRLQDVTISPALINLDKQHEKEYCAYPLTLLFLC